MEGFFHDAHEVYKRFEDGREEWVATFATKATAAHYGTWLTPPDHVKALVGALNYEVELRPV